jgi:putative transposase
VVVIKYRRKALYDEVIRERLKQIVWGLTDELGIEILAQEPAEDHLHIHFKASPTTNISDVVNVIKEVTARRIRQEFPRTKEFLWGVNGGVKLSNYGGIKLTTNLKSFLQA